MLRTLGLVALALGILASPLTTQAQQAKVSRVGVIHQGGLYSTVINGLRAGLRGLGLEEGKQFVLEIRDAKGDLKAVEEAARNLERERVNLISAVTTSVATAVRRAKALGLMLPQSVLIRADQVIQ